MLTWLLFAALVLGVGACMTRDFAAGRRNTSRLLGLGAQSTGSEQTRHLLVLTAIWVVFAMTEVVFLQRGFSLLPALVGISLMVLGRHLRREARSALGQRWTLDVVTLPGQPLVTGRIYDRMRHPEYLGTLLLFLGAPIVHGAWFTVGLSLLGGIALIFARVRLEEAVLDEDARYLSLLGDRPRFFPRRAPEGTHEPASPTRLRPRNRREDLPRHL